MTRRSSIRAVVTATIAILAATFVGTGAAGGLVPPSEASGQGMVRVHDVPPPVGWLAMIEANATVEADAAVEAGAPLLGSVTPAASELPACRYRDRITRYDQVAEWSKTLLDTILKVRRSYAPRDLVSVSRAGIGGSGVVRRKAIDDLREMAAAAKAAGKPIAVRSAYRSYDTQISTFQSWVDQNGYDYALLYAARPGHSEHQLGTTLDFRSAKNSQAPWDYSDWADTGPGRWMKKHAWEYGFVMSYPKGRRGQTCYGYEPWHYRYFGREGAAAIHESGVVPRRYLWEHFESVL